MHRYWKHLLLSGVLIAAVRPCLADGVIRDGLGAISGGRGGTNIAFEDNGEVLLDNPAGIGHVEGNGLVEVGADFLFTDLKYSDADNPLTSASNDPFPSGQLSYIRRSCDGRWAYGIGVYSVAGFSAVYDMNGPFPLLGPRHYKSLGMMAKVLPGLSYNVTDRFSIGGTFGLAASQVELEAPYFLQAPGPFQGTPMMLDLQTTGAAPCWSVGLRYELSDDTTVGATYTSPTHFRMSGTSVANVPGLGETRFDTDLDAAWPQSVGVGVKHKLCPHRIFSADVIWYGWSSAFDQFDLRFRNPTNPVFAALLGQTLPELFPLHWRDTVSVRLGHEHWIDDCHVLRLGYIYHRNPIPDATLTPYIQATLEHAFTFGYGWKYSETISLDAAYQYSFGSDRNVGASQIIGGDFANSHSESQVHWLFLSLMQKF